MYCYNFLKQVLKYKPNSEGSNGSHYMPKPLINHNSFDKCSYDYAQQKHIPPYEYNRYTYTKIYFELNIKYFFKLEASKKPLRNTIAVNLYKDAIQKIYRRIADIT